MFNRKVARKHELNFDRWLRMTICFNFPSEMKGYTVISGFLARRILRLNIAGAIMKLSDCSQAPSSSLLRHYVGVVCSDHRAPSHHGSLYITRLMIYRRFLSAELFIYICISHSGRCTHVARTSSRPARRRGQFSGAARRLAISVINYLPEWRTKSRTGRTERRRAPVELKQARGATPASV